MNTDTPAAARLFVGVYSAGIRYADRWHEENGDYAPLAFLPFSTLEIEWDRSPGTLPASLVSEILEHAGQIQARRGEDYPIDSCGHMVRLGGS